MRHYFPATLVLSLLMFTDVARGQVDVELKVVDQLGIRKNLSKPATYILDKEGNVRFAYVGQGVEDRPSVDAIIQQLKQLKSG